MELEIFDALTSAGVSPEKARTVAESIDKAIDRRYELHARQLATRGDLAELGGKIQGDLAALKTDLLKWSIGTMLTAVALFATITKLWH